MNVVRNSDIITLMIDNLPLTLDCGKLRLGEKSVDLPIEFFADINISRKRKQTVFLMVALTLLVIKYDGDTVSSFITNVDSGDLKDAVESYLDKYIKYCQEYLEYI